MRSFAILFQFFGGFDIRTVLRTTRREQLIDQVTHAKAYRRDAGAGGCFANERPARSSSVRILYVDEPVAVRDCLLTFASVLH